MSDKPFKMLGHELPGPNQRSALKNIEGRPDLAGSLFDPNRGRADVLGGPTSIVGGGTNQRVANQSTVAKGYGPVSESFVDNIERYKELRESTLQSQHSLGASNTEITPDETAKKNVDVEVTVNGEKI